MNSPEPPNKPPPLLDYHSATPPRDRPGATRPARVAGSITSVVLIAWCVYTWFIGGRRPRSNALPLEYIPALTVAFAGAAFCLLIALGIIGRRKSEDP